MNYAEDKSLSGTPAGSVASRELSGVASDEGISDQVPVIIVPVRTPAPEKPAPPPGSGGRKGKIMLAFGIPFVLVCAFRVYYDHINILPPMPHTTKRIIDVNAPPVDLAGGETIEGLLKNKSNQPKGPGPVFGGNNPLINAPTSSFGRRSASLKIEEKPLPIVIDRGEIPVSAGLKKLSAAEALFCRDSVINYVINATNGKDECTGLQKAFDETCSQDEEVEDPKVLDENDIWLGQDSGGIHRERRRLVTRQKQKQRKRRHLFATYKGIRRGLHNFLHKATQDAYWLLEWIGVPRPKFSADEAVYRTYRRFELRKIIKAIRRRKQWMRLTRRRLTRVEVGREKRLIQLTRRRLATVGGETDIDGPMDDDDDDDGVDGTVQDDDDITSSNATSSGQGITLIEAEAEPEIETAPPLVAQPKPHNILSLPTERHHVSAKTLEKTLLLQQEDKVISQVKKAVNATTNATKIDPKEDAAASAKAVQDTTDLVSAVLNDPSSIAARACCASILNVYHENCNVDAEEEISDKRLFIVVLIMAFCGMVKSLIRHFKIRWLPEAAGCILVGVASGYAASFFPHQDFSFDGNWFLRILVPPIVFEAALSIDKKAFNRHLVPIIIYSTIGTVMATFLTASMVHNSTLWLGRYCETIPYIESLIFGALISSIDPIAVLSVLSNMGMTDTDTLYVLVFGESLLNDGVAIVLFHTLVDFLDANKVVDSEAIMNAVSHFLVVALGSVLVGIGSGIMCTLYYWAFHGCQTPLVEVLMFLCWALLPYYVCDGIGWSGIVSSVTVGFVMDMYVIGLCDDIDDNSVHSHGDYDDDEDKKPARWGSRPIFSGKGHLSSESRMHIHFVTEIVATMMETAIFAYLGLFLFSHRYHWNLWHVIVSILACCVSRAIMIPLLSAIANWITSMQKYKNRCRGINKNSPATGVIVDRKMQMVLWFAGLRGAMSFALVEHIPLFDAVTGEGTRVKAELKAMTSASIMFTVFVLGGSTNYFMDYVGLAPVSKPGRNFNGNKMELIPLTSNGRKKEDLNGNRNAQSSHRVEMDNSRQGQKTRQRLRQKEDLER